MLNGFKLLTITHRHSSLKQVGRYVLEHADNQELQHQLKSLKQQYGLEEMVYLNTCNRVGYFCYTEQPFSSRLIRQFFQTVNLDLTPDEIAHDVKFYEGERAVRHWMRVAASVDSMVVGEREIFRQLRDSFALSKAFGITGDHFRLLMQYTVAAAKDAYANTRIGEKSLSVVSLGMKALLQYQPKRSARVLVIGAGKTNTTACKFLKKHKFTNVHVFNRTPERAQRLADWFGGKGMPLSDMARYHGGFDYLIVCTAATSAIVTPALYEQLLNGDTDKKVVIDLSIPNNVHADVLHQYELDYVEVENLRVLAEENLSFREAESEEALKILETHLSEFITRHQQRLVERAFSDIPDQVKAVKEKAIHTVFRKEVAALDEDTRALMERMLDYMEKKCVGIPMKIARESVTS